MKQSMQTHASWIQYHFLNSWRTVYSETSIYRLSSIPDYSTKLIVQLKVGQIYLQTADCNAWLLALHLRTQLEEVPSFPSLYHPTLWVALDYLWSLLEKWFGAGAARCCDVLFLWFEILLPKLFIWGNNHPKTLISPMSSLYARPPPVNWYSRYPRNRLVYLPYSWTVTLASHQKLSQLIIYQTGRNGKLHSDRS